MTSIITTIETNLIVIHLQYALMIDNCYFD